MDIETKVQEILAKMSKGERKYEEKQAKKQGFASIEAYIQNKLEAKFKSKITEDEKEKIIQLQNETEKARQVEVCKHTDKTGQPYFSLNGEFREGKLHGQGTVTWSTPHRLAGEKQVGEFREGKLHGQGTVTWSAPHRLAGEKQVGEFREGKLQRGTVSWSAPHQHAGVKYVGEFREGKLHGQGTVTWSAPTPSQLEKAQDLAREYVRKKYKRC